MIVRFHIRYIPVKLDSVSTLKNIMKLRCGVNDLVSKFSTLGVKLHEYWMMWIKNINIVLKVQRLILHTKEI